MVREVPRIHRAVVSLTLERGAYAAREGEPGWQVRDGARKVEIGLPVRCRRAVGFLGAWS